MASSSSSPLAGPSSPSSRLATLWALWRLLAPPRSARRWAVYLSPICVCSSALTLRPEQWNFIIQRRLFAQDYAIYLVVVLIVTHWKNWPVWLKLATLAFCAVAGAYNFDVHFWEAILHGH